LTAAIKAGHTVIAVVAVMFSLIGAFYYLRIIKLMYFDDAVDGAPLVATLGFRLLLSVNGIAVAAFGLFPDAVITLCNVVLLRSL
jgi:NADH-quinone oxidoreductase subunit N